MVCQLFWRPSVTSADNEKLMKLTWGHFHKLMTAILWFIAKCIIWSFKPVATSIIWTSFAET